MTDHLVPLRDGWSCWRVLRVRAAGFPARLVSGLAAPEAWAAAARFLDGRGQLEGARRLAIEQCERALIRADGPERTGLASTLRALRAGAEPPPPTAATFEAVERLRAARALDRELHAALEASLVTAGARAGECLRQLLGERRFREALIWQNRRSLREGLDGLRRRDTTAPPTKRSRMRELTVARYLQRYCTKNDTIGFFGPVAWGSLESHEEAVRLRAGPELLSRRTVHPEYWFVKALADHLAADDALLRWMAPRRAPALQLQGTTLSGADGRAARVPLGIARLLAACDGRDPALVVAARLVADPELDFGDEDEVHAVMADLTTQGLMAWTVEVSPDELDPLRALRELVEQVGDVEARRRALAVLDRFELARQAVERAAGDPDALDPALDRFDAAFEEVAGVAAVRNAGQTYGGRSLLYEDCVRDLDLSLGRRFLDRVGPPLALVLTSARWFTHEIARRYRVALGGVFRRLCDERREEVIDLHRFWDGARALFPGGHATGSIVAEVASELEARWAEILRLPADAARCDRAHAEIAAGVAARFDAPAPGWPTARYQSPDLLIAARGLDAIARGDYLVVLGELHAGMNTVLSPVFVKEYAAPEALLEAREADIPTPCVARVWSHARTRADYVALARHDLSLEDGSTRARVSRDRVLTSGELLVAQRRGQLEVRTRDDRWRFDIVAFLEQHLVAESHAHFRVVPPRRHSPRVTVDGLVLARESWRAAREELPFLSLTSAAERYVGALRWFRERGAPRRTFVKVPHETKPFFVDLESPLLVENFVRAARAGEGVAVSEALPDLDETWLVDSAQESYTSELRIAAVDSRQFTPP